MNYSDLTPYELMKKTVKDIAIRRELEKEGQRQAKLHDIENRARIQRRLYRKR